MIRARTAQYGKVEIDDDSDLPSDVGNVCHTVRSRSLYERPVEWSLFFGSFYEAQRCFRRSNI